MMVIGMIMKQEELKVILENHKHWIYDDCVGCKEMCADLRNADLRYADLCNADLRYADLRNADLRYADLRNADSRCADLRCADLRYVDLSYADLRYVDLSNANLRYVDLRYADLCNADLRYADLRYANLCGADLLGANLLGANLRGAKNIPFIPYACPDFGKFIGYKKASNCIVELEIPEDAKRLSATSRKCRCNKAKVLRILNFDRTVADITEVKSNYDNKFIYKVGDIVSVDNFDEDRWNECSTGIHFFINFKEAVDY